MRGIEAQFLALQKGFGELISQHLLRPFDERELEVITQIYYAQPLREIFCYITLQSLQN